MDRFCQNCGAELPEDCDLCPVCNPVSAETPQCPCDSEQSVTKKKKRRWIIPVAAILVLLLTAVCFWNPLFMRIAPQAYLSWTMNRTNADMAKRQEGSVSSLLKTAGACFEKGSVSFKVEYSNPDIFNTSGFQIDLSVKSDPDNKQWMTAFNTSGALGSSSFSLYASDHHISAGTSLFREGKHFGITYSSIEEDLRGSVLGQDMSDEDIQATVDVVEAFETLINNGKDPEAYKPYMELMVDFIKELKPEISKEQVEIDGKDKKCDSMTFRIDHDQLADLMEDMLELAQEDENFNISDSFKEQYQETLNTFRKNSDMDLVLTYYFYRNKVAAMDIGIDLTYGEEKTDICLDLFANYGTDASRNDIVVDYEVKIDGNTVEGSVTSSIEKQGNNCKETLTIKADGYGLSKGIMLDIVLDWKRDDQKLDVSVSGRYVNEVVNVKIPFVLKEKNDGFDLFIEDLISLMSAAGQDTSYFKLNDEFTLLIKFRDNCKITAPDYVNLNQIMQEDVNAFMDLMGALGFGESEEENIYW